MGNSPTKNTMSSSNTDIWVDSKQQHIHSNKSITPSTSKMDEKNKEALKVLKEEGDDAFVNHVFTGENGQKLTYSEMRERYG
jgi:hypothetical protein